MRTAITCIAVLAALSSAACHTMRPVTLDQLRGIGPSQVLVTRADRSVAVVAHPQVLGDTLVGFVNRKYQVMPAAALQQMLVRQPAPRRTAALVAIGVIGLAGFAYATLSGSGPTVASTGSKCEIFESGTNVECPQV